MDRLLAFISSSHWVNARTYEKTAPHEYVIKTPENRKEFEWVVVYIRLRGEKRPFWKKVYTYLDVDGYTYWTMGNPIHETKVLNRAKL